MAKIIQLRDVAFRSKSPLSGFVALVDDIDFDRVSQHEWRIGRSNYPYTSLGNGNVICLHHFIAGRISGEMVVDHINQVKCDARRCNLRVITKKENSTNKKFYWSNTRELNYRRMEVSRLTARRIELAENIFIIQSLYAQSNFAVPW